MFLPRFMIAAIRIRRSANATANSIRLCPFSLGANNITDSLEFGSGATLMV